MLNLFSFAFTLAAASAMVAPAEGAYISGAQVPDGLAILPPPPRSDSLQAAADRAIFDVTRRLRGTPRWRIAADDASNAPFNRYACAIGMRLDARLAPNLGRLLARVGTGQMVDPVKRFYSVRRPFVGTHAPICEARTLHLASNGDYPSGHAANGWLEALILAELLPDRASAILARGRAYGESRAVCGSHTMSAVEAGWIAGSSMFAALNAAPAFQRDLGAASRELASLRRRASKPDANRCAAELAALSIRPW